MPVYNDFLKLVFAQSTSEQFTDKFSEDELSQYSKQWYQDVNDVYKILEDEKYDVALDILDDVAKTSVWSKYVIDQNIEKYGLHGPDSHYYWATFIVSSGNKDLFVTDPASKEVMTLLESYFKVHDLIECNINHLGFDNKSESIVDAVPDLELVTASNMKMTPIATK